MLTQSTKCKEKDGPLLDQSTQFRTLSQATFEIFEILEKVKSKLFGAKWSKNAREMV